MVTSTLFLTIFIGALVSGWHCALMCGGIAAGVERLKNSSDSVPLRKMSRLSMVFEQLTMIWAEFLAMLRWVPLPDWLVCLFGSRVGCLYKDCYLL